jgi:cytochrome c-type biogenesis protein CcmF
VKITKAGAPVCEAKPERRFYPTGKQTTSEVAICPKVLDDLYVVLGERRAGRAASRPGWCGPSSIRGCG